MLNSISAIIVVMICMYVYTYIYIYIYIYSCHTTTTNNNNNNNETPAIIMFAGHMRTCEWHMFIHDVYRRKAQAHVLI